MHNSQAPIPGARATVHAPDRRHYQATAYSASTRGLRALAGIAEDLDLDRQVAEDVAESVEAVERLQRLRKELLEAGAEAKQLGLSAPALPAVQLLQSEAELHALLVELEELVRRERERLIALDEAEMARRDMRMLMQQWLMALARPRNEAALGEMVQTLDRALAEHRTAQNDAGLEAGSRRPC